MIALATPSPNLIKGGYPARPVCGAWLGRSGKVSGIGARRSRRVELAGVKGCQLASSTAQMADFRRFLLLGHGPVAGSSVAGSPKAADFRAFRVPRRLMGDYRRVAGSRSRSRPAAHARGRDRGVGCPPFSLAAEPTRVARVAAGPGKSFRPEAGRPLPTLSASTGQAKTAAGHGVGVRGASSAPREGRKITQKTGRGAGLARANPPAWRRGGAAIEGADFAGMQSVAAPVGVKGEATLCAPWTLVN